MHGDTHSNLHPSAELTAPRDLVLVAHRAGNDLRRLAAAEAAGADLVEADVHVHGRELEVRHLKALGPLPVLWDRWYVVDGRTPRLPLREVLATMAPGTRLLLDLKGPSRRLAPLVRRAIDGQPPGAITVCSRTWMHLRGFGPDVPAIRSVGSRLQLVRHARLRDPGDAVAVAARLLDPSTAAALRGRVPTVLVWGVRDEPTARRALALGATGLILDDLELLQVLRRHA